MSNCCKCTSHDSVFSSSSSPFVLVFYCYLIFFSFHCFLSLAPSVTDPLLTDDEIQVSSIDDQIKKYEEFFSRLSPLVGELNDPADTVNKIIGTPLSLQFFLICITLTMILSGDEFQNFSRFNFINETHKQCDMLEASINTLKEELEQSKKASDTGGDKIRKKLLEGLQVCSERAEELQ
jgi:hypothetical protein